MTTRRCHSCTQFYDVKLSVCPHCGTPKHAYNEWLRTAALNSGLYRQIQHAKDNH